MLARSRVTVLSTLTAMLTITLTIALTFVTGPAKASTADTITIRTPVTVTVIALGGAGGERLAVTADSTTPLVSMTVHLLNAVGTDTVDMPMQPPAGSPPARGPQTSASTWMSGDITPQSLPLGNYSLTVDAADQGGTAVSDVPAGAFPFLDTPRIAPAGETITPVVPPTATTHATGARPVLLTVRTAITGFVATMNPYWKVSFHGCLGLAAETPGYVPALAGLTIQYSDSPGGPWRTLGAVAAQRGNVCGNDGRTFTGALTTRASGAYYRASYPGTAVHKKTTGDLPSASASVHAWKYNARIGRFTVSKRTVARGGKLTVSGQLQYESIGKWHSLAHQVVQIILLPKKSHTWYWIARVTTNANGDFSATFTDPVTATWSAEYLGGKTHLAAVGAMIGVTLK